MPTYSYGCDNCKCAFDLVQKISDKPALSCTNCGSDKISKLLTAPAYCKTSKTCKTVGQQAELNEKRLGKDGLELLAMEDRIAKAKGREVVRQEFSRKGVEGTIVDKPAKDKENPWWRADSSEPLDTTKITDTSHYIQTGEVK